MIVLEHVSRRFGRTPALIDACLVINPGDSLALWGSNGAGKTTLIRCVLGLLRHQGRVLVGGHDVRRKGKLARRLIGYVPQELAFYDDLRLAEAVTFFSRLKGLHHRRPSSVLQAVGLADHASKRVRELSGGMKQRLALAIALIGDPPVLVLDEVTASLDACGRQEFIALLGRMAGQGRTLLFASHRIDEVAQLAGRVACMDAGRISAIHDALSFSSRLETDAVLHLMIAPPQRDAAIALLRANGFNASLNGVGILVPVSKSQRAAPFRVLASASFSIDDFELVSASASAVTHLTGCLP